MPLPLPEEVRGRCRQYLGTAKIAWGQLTDDEGLKARGHAERLAGRNQEQAARAGGEAERKAGISGQTKE
jgi:uncharacterized protein YjbJ (UPF0337 family)